MCEKKMAQSDSVLEKKPIYCGVIQSQLVVSSCPLQKGSCMWKHRLHGGCMYSEQIGTYNEKTSQYEFTPNEFAYRVGLPQIDSGTVNILRNILKQKVQKELTE